MGASRNAELAILLAATFPESISGLIAFAPSAVSWSNTVLPFSADEIKPSWTYKGVAIPYLPMNKINGNETNEIEVLDYWKNGLSKQDHVEKAALKIENVKGPILLFSGNDDKVWPAATMADMIQKRASENDFKFKLHNIKYENAGHMISGNPDDKTTPRTGTIHIKGKNYQYKYGGTDKGDYKAKQDAKSKLLKFLESL